MDMLELMIPLIVVIMVMALLWKPIQWIVEFLHRRSMLIIWRQQDLHGNIMKKNKLVAKANLRGSSVRWLYCTGNKDTRPIKWARVRGIIWGRDCVQVFFQFSRFSSYRWAIIPKELCDDSLGRVLRVRCACFRSKGNFYVPVYVSELTKEEAARYDRIVNDYEQFLIDDEMIVEIKEQSVDSTIEAIGCNRPAERVTTREDTLEASGRKELTERNKEPAEAV
ncbi:MAG: hypothetical protein HPY73_05720 [Methanomassiliicoccales archaeon]|nr:MAG: hypothetical protein HPY73_05720 [Methanomassiliicoccales archaeon]